MTSDEIKARLAIDDATVRLSDNGGWYWVNITRDHDGNRYSFTHRLTLEPSDRDFIDAKETIEQWWTETTNPPI